jgi:DNA polymerase-3 subunit beta
MHIQIPQKDLEQATNIVSGLVDRSSGPQPVLGNLLVEADDTGVHFRGTDMESSVVVNLSAAVKRPGKTTVPAETFKEIVKLFPPQGEVDFQEAGRKVTVSCEANEYKLMTIPADEFPLWNTEAGTTRFQLSQKTLKYLIEAATYALPQKDHRRVLMGVNFELHDMTLRLTATDGKKLARVFTPLPEIEGATSGNIVVPRKLIDNVAKFLTGEGPVDVEMSQRQISFRFANVTYRGNGIDGKYPDCDAVIPKEFPITIPLHRDHFLQGARRAGVTTDEKHRSVILKFENGAVHFSSMSHDLGAFAGRIPVDYNGNMIELAFNFQFLLETLSRFSKPELKMFIKSSSSPVVVRAQDEENRLALLMPIKLSDARPAPPSDEEEAGE